MSKIVVGVFNSYDESEKAISELKNRGIDTNKISLLTKGTNNEEGRFTNDNISNGTVNGGIVGGVAGLLIGMGTIAVPGLGVIAAAGPIAGLLSGALAGGIIGGLADLGIPEEAGRRYESEIREGRILCSIKAEDDKVDTISSVLKECGARSVETH